MNKIKQATVITEGIYTLSDHQRVELTNIITEILTQFKSLASLMELAGAEVSIRIEYFQLFNFNHWKGLNQKIEVAGKTFTVGLYSEGKVLILSDELTDRQLPYLSITCYK